MSREARIAELDRRAAGAQRQTNKAYEKVESLEHNDPGYTAAVRAYTAAVAVSMNASTAHLDEMDKAIEDVEEADSRCDEDFMKEIGS